MAEESSIELATLRFEGARFSDNALDVECTPELVAYRKIVLECAKALWRRANPDRRRLPKRFGTEFRLQFDRLESGSAVVPLRRLRVWEQAELDLEDDTFDQAARLIDETIAAANDGRLLPTALPPSVIPLFREFGTSLREDETLYTKGRTSHEPAAYSARARNVLAHWIDPQYEDRVSVTGEVRMANLSSGGFTLRPEGTELLVKGQFTPEQEALVLDALHDHSQCWLKVEGLGEFSTTDRQLQRIARVDRVSVVPRSSTPVYDTSLPPIWERLASIGSSVPKEAWDTLPANASENVDGIIYGTDRKDE